MSHKETSKEVGRPLADIQVEYDRKNGRASKPLLVEGRPGKLCHYPAVTNIRGICKKPGCKGKICMMCIKCKVHLCLNKIEIVFLNSIRTDNAM